MIESFYQGIPMDLQNRADWVAIIGPRKCTESEYRAAFSLAKKCAEKGKIIISGLAEGIDTAAHKGALAGGGITIAVLSISNTESIYPPQNKPLSEEIMQRGGLIKPFTNQTVRKNSNDKGPSQYIRRLWERDILVAHLCPIIMAVKDGLEPIDGGTRWALNYGKEFNKKIFRYNSQGKSIGEPTFKKANAYWDMELDISSF